MSMQCIVCCIYVVINFGVHDSQGDLGKPLLLTPLIEANNIESARNLAFVNPLLDGTVSYSGFFTVNKRLNSNTFVWFFPAQENNDTAPVLVWLQGGPGATSMFGLFSEFGPFRINKSLVLEPRKITWISNHNILFIDNPLGTGYSFTDTDEGYSRNEVEIGNNLYKVVFQFFLMFPEFRKNGLFISGESYGGKYVPALSYAIHTKNPHAKLKLNLVGFSIGNGFCDPEHMLHYDEFLYQIGLIDLNGREVMKRKQGEIVSLIQQKQWIEAFNGFEELINDELTTRPTLYNNLTGFKNYYDFLDPNGSNLLGDLTAFVQTNQFRTALHVGNATFHSSSSKVIRMLLEDFMQSVKPWIEILLDHGYRCLIYNGQRDVSVAYPMTLGFLQALKWCGAEEYKTAARKQWRVGDDLAGYSKTVKNFIEVMVRDAGHMTPTDQPVWSHDLITRFTRNKPF